MKLGHLQRISEASDGTVRCDFRDRIRKSVYVGGHFKVKGPDSEEVSAKLNGGPHTSGSPENTYADTMDLGITNFLGTRSRVRWEKTHPNYSSSISPSSSALPVVDIRGKWRGFRGLKINLDTNGDGTPDRVALIGMVDVGGLDPTAMKPVNNWNHIQSCLCTIRNCFKEYLDSLCCYYW